MSPSRVSRSNATSVWPDASPASSSNSTWVSPEASLGVNATRLLNGSPSLPRTGSPLSRSMSVPSSSYSTPGSRFS